MFAQLRIHAVGRRPHGQFAQRRQIALHKEGGQRPRGLIFGIDFALLQAIHQLIRRQVDQFNLVRHFQHAIRHGFPHPDAGDARHRFIQRLDMLDVQRGEDVDARRKHLLHILPALFMAAALGIGMGQFVDEREVRLAGKKGIKIHLGQHAPLIEHGLAGKLRQTCQLGLCFGAAMGFDQRGDHVTAPGRLAMGVVKHRPGFAHAGGCAKKDLKLSPSLTRGLREEGFGRGAEVSFRRHSLPAVGIGKAASRAMLVKSTFTRASP